MLQAGKNVTQLNDPMQKLNVEQLYRALVNPRQPIKDSITQLRNILTIDPKKYSQLKRRLPYVTCGIFNPPYRRTEHFASIEVFILDVDHISEKGLTTTALKEKLQSDPRIELMFESPGGDGIKLLFRLKEKCFDAVKYSMFYKVFSQAFSQQYNLDQVLDTRTSDVTRACFISMDDQAHYNPDPEKISMESFIDFNDPFQVMEVKNEVQKSQEENKPEIPDKELTDDVLQKIRQKLNPNIRTAKPKNISVPEELNQIMTKVEAHLAGYDLKIAEVKNIHYGKQIKIIAPPHFAVINVFYGKNGYKIVDTNKTGSSDQLTEIARKVLCELLY